MISKLKKGAPFLIYYYYNFENKNLLYKYLWRISDYIRSIICKLPFSIKRAVTFLIALLVYYPMARSSIILPKMIKRNWPLSEYSWRSFYSMRTALWIDLEQL